MKKRFFAAALSLVFAALSVFLGACSGGDPPEQTSGTEPPETTRPNLIVSNEPVSVKMFDPDAALTAISLGTAEPLGFRFVANAPFDGLAAECPSWGNDIGAMTISLLVWDKDFLNTAAADPVANERFIDYKDNETLVLEFPEVPAGEYLLLFSEPVEVVGVWSSDSNISNGLIYSDGIEKAGDLRVTIEYTKTPSEPFGSPEKLIDLSVPVTTPPKPEYPADHILNQSPALSDTWAAVDGLGRVLPGNDETGDVREDKFVGIFYWTWHGEQSKSTAPNNVTEIISKNPGAIYDLDFPGWGKIGAPHHWDEPLFGYYSTVDEWVLRRHAEMLADAGVDVVIFDNTNGTFTWRDSYITLFRVFAEARADGVNTPQISFLLPFGASEDTNTQLEKLYLDIYRQDKYRDLWFYWKGKPLLMAHPNMLNAWNDPLHAEIAEFFTFRPGQPLYSGGQVYDRWGWLSVYPQQVYYNEDGTPEQMAVGVAQNWSAEAGLTAMNGQNVFGRTYTSEGYDKRKDAKLYGANFAEQFEYALEVDPEFIFITGWNEWVAGRHSEWGGVTNAFPDQFNEVFSRDIEPTKGDLKDHYYYQMVSYIRQFKGTNKVQAASGEKTVNINGSLSQWNSVTPVYRSYAGNTLDRASAGYVGTFYENKTGRNDIVLARVAHDSQNVYFYVETAEKLTPSSDPLWMRLLIDTGDSAKSFEGFEYIVNRQSPGEKALIERSKGGWSFEKAGEASYSVKDNVLQLAVPRSALGIGPGDFELNFKWADNNLEKGDIMDLYQYGDAAPGGRFMYVYRTK